MRCVNHFGWETWLAGLTGGVGSRIKRIGENGAAVS